MSTPSAPSAPSGQATRASPPARALLALAAVAVAFAAADTYVVVLALPDMMLSVGLGVDELQRAAPIVSGFLLGYVAMLPLIGRVADLRGRVPVLVASLVLFAAGSLVTALAPDLGTLVVGRFWQGVGGGGLVPATLALVADLYPVQRRAVPLGVVSAVQEIGSVVGPLLGAVILALADWRAIFALNLAVGLVLAAGLAALGRRGSTSTRTRTRPDLVSVGLMVLLVSGVVLTLEPPRAWVEDLVLGIPFVPLVGSLRWSEPVALATLLVAAVLVWRSLVAQHPLVDLRAWGRTFAEADLLGAVLLGLALAGVILAFATADPSVQVFSPLGGWMLLAGAVAAAAFVVRSRAAADPLVPRGALRHRAAWSSLLVSFLIGSSLIAALVDVPVYARLTTYPDSQLAAALVLLRFLVALPVGAVLGGVLTRRLPAGVVVLVGMVPVAGGYAVMSRWGATSLESPWATVPLVVAGLGFGLALAPVNAALLASTDAAVHGVASALVVVARMVGMLVGISALTTLGLRQYFLARADLPPVLDVCDGASRCPAYSDLAQAAVLVQIETIFVGAAVCALLAGLLGLVLFRGARTRSDAPAVTAGA